MLILLLVSGTIVSLSMGMRQSMGLFMGPLTTDLGISAATFSFSLALQNNSGVAHISGRMSGSSGAGTWSSNTAYCGGRWRARRN